MSIQSEGVAMLVASALAGVLLGTMYFGGLWLTVQRIERANHPVAILATSFIVRLGLVLVGFYLISDGRIERLVACLVAFFLTRLFFVKRIQPATERSAKAHGNQP